MTNIEYAQKLEDEVQVTLLDWDVEEIAALSEAADAIHEGGFYNLQGIMKGY